MGRMGLKINIQKVPLRWKVLFIVQASFMCSAAAYRWQLLVDSGKKSKIIEEQEKQEKNLRENAAPS